MIEASELCPNCMACHAPATLHCPVPFCRAPFCSKRCYKITYKPHAKVTHPAISSSNSCTVKASSHGGLGVFASTAVTKVSERDCDRSEGEAKRRRSEAKRSERDCDRNEPANKTTNPISLLTCALSHLARRRERSSSSTQPS